MNKKILLLASIVVLAVVAIGSVSAFDLGSLTGGDEGTTVTIGGEEFTIPAGYEENTDLAVDDNVTEYSTFTSTLNEKVFDKGDDFIIIMVSEYDGTDVDDDLINFLHGESKKINDIEGFQQNDDTTFSFSYGKDNKVITVSATQEEVLNQIIA